MKLQEFLRRLMPVSNATFHHRMNSLDSRLNGIDASLKISLAMEKQLRQFVMTEDSQTKAYYLVCEAGYPNYSDELITREWLKYLSLRYPEVPVYLDCARPGPATTILRGVHPHMHAVDTLSRLASENVYANAVDKTGQVEKITQFIHDALENDGVAARYASGIRLLRTGIRSVHYLGGGYMNSAWPHNLARLGLVQWCSEHDIPVLATGAGLMPLKTEDLSFAQRMVNALYRSVRGMRGHTKHSPKITSNRINHCALPRPLLCS